MNESLEKMSDEATHGKSDTTPLTDFSYAEGKKKSKKEKGRGTCENI